jgi:hypothetical protein
MKTSIALLCALFLANSVLADPYSAAMKQARNVSAKASKAANQTDETTPPPSPSSPPQQQPPPQNIPPPNPALQATLQNIASLRDDFAALGRATDTNSAAVLKMSLLNNLAAAAHDTKPSQKSISKLGDDLTTAIAGKEKLRAPQPKLAQDVHAVFNSSHLTEAQQKMITDDLQKILTADGITPDDITNVINDVKMIVTETK